MAGSRAGFAAFRNQTSVTDEADVVIVGTGAAGATAARVLTDAGLDVILVEEGPDVPDTGFPLDQWSAFRDLWRDAGFQASRGRSFLGILQGSCVGGTTVINGAIVHRMPRKIWEVWDKEHGVGDDLRWDDLQRVFDRLDEELSVAPTPADIAGRNNLLMKQGLDALGIEGNFIRRNVAGCRGSTRCLQGCPTAQKRAMHLTYVPFAVERGARVYSEAPAGQIIVDGRRRAVSGRFRCHATGALGAQFTFSARRAIVVAASAIQTPLLLHRSRLGRPSGLVGRRFQAHPGASVLGVFDQPVRLWEGSTQGYETTHWWDERMKFEAVGMPVEVLCARLPGFGAAMLREVEQMGHVTQWGVQIRATTHGRVRPALFGGGASITYDITPEDCRRFRLGIRRLIEMQFAAGAREVLPGVHGLPERLRSVDEARALDNLPDDPRLFHSIASHLFGTAVLGRDPKHSVVTTGRHLHEAPGVYIADSSVFPTNLGVNPMHTISAVAWLTAERIVEGRDPIA